MTCARQLSHLTTTLSFSLVKSARNADVSASWRSYRSLLAHSKGTLLLARTFCSPWRSSALDINCFRCFASAPWSYRPVALSVPCFRCGLTQTAMIPCRSRRCSSEASPPKIRYDLPATSALCYLGRRRCPAAKALLLGRALYLYIPPPLWSSL